MGTSSQEVSMTDFLKGNWNELKGKLRKQWAKLTDDDVERIRGDIEELSGRLQKMYGYTKEQAAAEIERFKNATH
jgi:uncharacterized protein YjbJ (UPF0337 family)